MDCSVRLSPNTNNWTFYNTFQLKMCGTGINTGTSLLVTNPGEAMNHPLQIGTGANDLRSNLGGGIWFGSFTGDFVFNLTEISLSPLTVNAGADATICYGQSKALTAVDQMVLPLIIMCGLMVLQTAQMGQMLYLYSHCN
ncbi:MAG: hypothetical protein IPO94_08585 [Saprospiraceae bacterium]|nr:hypothetical protein [Saprospiraceae bacterium]